MTTAFLWVLPSEPATVPEVRRRLDELLASWPPPQRDDVLLAASEVVTNAVVHGEGPVAVLVRAYPHLLRFEVTDNGAAVPQPNLHAGQDGESGRGLLIIDALTTRWGVQPASTGAGKTLWFEVEGS